MTTGQDDPTRAARESVERAEALVRRLQAPGLASRLLSNTICYLATLVLMGWAIKNGHPVAAVVFLGLSLLVLLWRRRI